MGFVRVRVFGRWRGGEEGKGEKRWGSLKESIAFQWSDVVGGEEGFGV